MPEQWTNPEYADVVQAWRELEAQPEAAVVPGIRGFLIPVAEADKQE
jgi:hypothetical protein